MKAKRAKAGNSPALAAARDAGIAHTVHRFEHDPAHESYGVEAARALGCNPAQVFKTLVWLADDSACLALVPVPEQVSAKRLAAALGKRRAVMAQTTDAERLSGSVVGAISPLGLRRPVPVVLDESARSLERLYISAGRRGVEIEMNPRDLIELTSALVAPITLGSRAT